MSTTTFPAAPAEFCVTDVGSTTTKALLFRRESGRWTCSRFETPTTVEKPHEDVTVGVLGALAGLERLTGARILGGGRPAVPYLSTSSAGGGLAMVVTGLVRELTAETADRAALGAGAIVLDVIAMDDGRSPYRKIEDLRRLRPDMVLFAGGFDADAVTGPVFLAEMLLEAGLKPKLNPAAQLPVVYAGNTNAEREVRSTVGGSFLFRAVPNVRPAIDRENLEPARRAILELFMDHVMSQAPGYEKLKEWVAAPILPTPAAFGNLLGLVSRSEDRHILAIDIGGATTDVFSAAGGEVFRTVSANLGLSYSIRNVATLAGITAIRELYHPHLDDGAMWNRIGNKHINPTRLARNPDEMLTEWAAAAVAIREAVRQHMRLRAGSAREEGSVRDDLNDLLREPREITPRRPVFKLDNYDLVIGSGGILSHSPRDAAVAVLLDALHPRGSVELAVDSEFMFPHLGVLADVNPELALELYHSLGFVRLGMASGFRAPAELIPRNYAPPPRPEDPAAETRIREGEIRRERLLGIPGEVFVKPGARVETGTLVARSTRQFLRPFFLHVADDLEVPEAELHRYLVKRPGDSIGPEDVIARRPRRFLPDKTFRSPVAGRIEKLLPGGTLLVRETPEHSREYTAVPVAEEMDVEPERLEPYLRVAPGQEVERGQWLAAEMTKTRFRHVASPVRGRVNRIDRHFGIVLIEPLLEETEVRAWLPGIVETTSERGCAVLGRGTELTGVWGSGGEAGGELMLSGTRFGCPAKPLTDSVIEPGKVAALDFADSASIAVAREKKPAGLVCAGVDLQDVLAPTLGFTLVVLGGFGEHRLSDDVRGLLAAHTGRLALVDGTTQLRVGVRRPCIILPDEA